MTIATLPLLSLTGRDLISDHRSGTIHLDIFERTQNIANPLERFDVVVHELYTTLDRESKALMIIYKDIWE